MKTPASILFVSFFLLLAGCKENRQQENIQNLETPTEVPVSYASGFTIDDYGTYKILTVKNPWPGAGKSYRYLLALENAHVPEGIDYDQKVTLPVENLVVTSTTHIPALEMLNEEKSLVGFPGLSYISSEKFRSRIDSGKIRELGKNEALNTESLLALQPDVVVGFSIDGSNKSLQTIQKSGIPVVFNGDWTEHSPLGKAEWIKFFGALFQKDEKAAQIFKEIETAYLEAKELVKQSDSFPGVVAGAMYKDQWYLPAGESWQAQFIEDAGADYLFKDTEGTGSLSLSFENVLTKAGEAEFWIGPAQFTTYEELKNASSHYERFSAFRNKNIFTFSSRLGETGGVLFYELGPNRPDLVLKDLISIFHPQLLPGYETTFYKQLE